MDSNNTDVLFQEPINRMSRSQFLRRSFGNSHKTSPGSRRGLSRIAKATGPSNSPHDIQRRRTTASHAVRATHAASQTIAPYATTSVAGSTWSDQPRRPMSWHPGSSAYPAPAATHVLNDVSLGNTIADFETLAVSGSTQPLYEDPMGVENFPSRHGGRFDPTGLEHINWQSLATEANLHCHPFLQSGFLRTNQYCVQNPYDGSYGQAGLPQPPCVDSNVTSSDYQLPASVEELCMQYPNGIDYSEALRVSPHITSKKSKELVGMGLYDDKNGSMLSAANMVGMSTSGTSAGLHRNSLGKGLKLEETWQPPSEAAIDEAEDYSSDEAEDLPVAPPSQQPEAQVFAGYKDLSNQTFFFENDDPYSNYIAFDQAMQYCEPKAPDPALGNFLWL